MDQKGAVFAACGILALFYLFRSPPEFASPSVSLPHCPSPRTFGELTDYNYFVFIGTKHGDSSVIQNLCYFLGLKYNKTFAVNIEHPVNFYGLSSAFLDSSYVQGTPRAPSLICAEMDYDEGNMERILEARFVGEKKVVVGFVRDPQEMFLSCLLRITLYKRSNSDRSVSMLLDQNVMNYITKVEELAQGNSKSDHITLSPHACNNQLAFSLGLSSSDYRPGGIYDGRRAIDAADLFAMTTKQRVSDFVVHERMTESLFMLKEKYCLYPEEDFTTLSRLAESYVGIGLGELSDSTKDRLRHFLRYDYAIYNSILASNQQKFEYLISDWETHARYEHFLRAQRSFAERCSSTRLSLVPREAAIRAYELTREGRADMQCSLVNENTRLLANMIYQMQSKNLTGTVSAMIAQDKPYNSLLQSVADSLDLSDK